MAEFNNWGPAAVIVLGYLAGTYWNGKRFDDFKLWMQSEVKRIESTLTSEIRRIEEKHDNAIKRLEDKIDAIRSPISR